MKHPFELHAIPITLRILTDCGHFLRGWWHRALVLQALRTAVTVNIKNAPMLSL